MNAPRIAIGKVIADVSSSTLRFYRQIGVEAVTMPSRWNVRVTPTRPHIPPTQRGPAPAQPPPWDRALLARIKERIEAFDLAVGAINLPVSGNILMGLPGRDADIEAIGTCLRVAGELGIPVAAYNFTALRPSEGYGSLDGQGRGGADLRDYDAARVADQSPVEGVGRHDAEAMWARLEYFLQAVVPMAEAAGVRIAVHPNDPPVPVFRGVAQPLSDLAGLRRLLAAVDSPYNCLFMDTGVITELGEDAAAAIREFGPRIATVHFRNVRVLEPRYRYVETFHDEGDADLLECMRAFHEVGYEGMLDPDHTPRLSGDGLDMRQGFALGVGQMIALRRAVT